MMEANMLDKFIIKIKMVLGFKKMMDIDIKVNLSTINAREKEKLL